MIQPGVWAGSGGTTTTTTTAATKTTTNSQKQYQLNPTQTGQCILFKKYI